MQQDWKLNKREKFKKIFGLKPGSHKFIYINCFILFFSLDKLKWKYDLSQSTDKSNWREIYSESCEAPKLYQRFD